MEPFELDTGNTAWMLAAASLVLLMTPALAFFYGGMTRSKSVLNMMMMSFGALAVVGPIWMLWGYSETFGEPALGGLIGNPVRVLRTQGPHRREQPDGRVRRARHGGRRLPGDVRHHHRRADQRRHRRPRAVRHLAGLLRPLGHPGLRPDRARGLGRRVPLRRRQDRRVAVHPDRLRRWHRRAHQRRYGRLHARADRRQAEGLRQGPDEAAQPAVRDARRRPAVVRLVRLQRRLRVRRRRHRRPGVGQHPRSRPVSPPSAG